LIWLSPLPLADAAAGDAADCFGRACHFQSLPDADISFFAAVSFAAAIFLFSRHTSFSIFSPHRQLPVFIAAVYRFVRYYFSVYSMIC